MRSRASSRYRAASGLRLRCVPARISSAARTARTSTSCARRPAGSRRAAPRVFSAPRPRTEPASRSRRRTARAALTRRRSLPSSPDSASTCRISRPARSSTPAASASAGSPPAILDQADALLGDQSVWPPSGAFTTQRPRVDNFFTNPQRVTSIRLALEGGTGATGGEPVAVGCSSAVVQPLGREVRDVLTVDIALPDVEELHKLVAEGKEKGFLSYDEIVNGIEDVELTKEQVEDFYTYLVEHGVDLVEGEQHKAPLHEQQLPEDEKAVVAPKLDLTVEPSLDSLRLYLREIGKVALLTAGQEVTLAKRIDRGDMGAKTAMIEV